MIKLPIVKTTLDVGILMLIIKTLIQYSSIIKISDTADTLISICAAICMAFEIFKKKYNLTHLLIYGIISALSLITCKNVGNWTILISVLTILACKDVDLDSVLYFIFKYESIFLVLHSILAISLIPFGFSIVEVVMGDKCLNMGLTHPNMFGAMTLNLILLWIWINYEQLEVKTLAVMFSIVLFVSVITGCRSLLYGGTLTLVFVLFHKITKNITIFQTVLRYLPMVISLIMYVLVIHYTSGSQLVRLIDSWLSGRIKFGAYLYEHFGLSILGQDLSNFTMKWDSVWKLNSWTFDNLYTCLMINYGLIWLSILAIVSFVLSKMQDARVLIMFIVWCFYGITEVHGMNCYLSFPILFVSLLFSNLLEQTEEGERED